ncbi:MAG: carbohydrate porin [Bacteroidota bacterium]
MQNSAKGFIVILTLILVFNVAHAQDTTWFGYGGYIRSGFGVDGQGKPLDVFKAPNSEAKYRLGNESETYAETVFKYFLQDENEALFETNMRLAFVAPTSSSNSFETTISVREAFVKATGLLRSHKELSFWAGQRFYSQIEVHIKDYFPRDMTGFGGGFEGLALGESMRLAVAYLGGSIDQLNPDGTVKPENQFSFNKSTLDINLYDIDVGFGKIGLTLDLSMFHGDSLVTAADTYHVSNDRGWSAGIYHEKGFEGGRNYLHLFYGTGAAENGMALITQPMGITLQPGDIINPDGFRRFRVVNDLKVDFGPRFSMLGLLMYQKLNNNMPQNNILDWYTAGVRPVWFFNRYFSLVGELGVDYTSQEGLEDGSLFKMTLAPQLSPFNRILTRPALRAYVTWASWSDSFMGDVAPLSFPDQTHGISVGLQMEVWW